MNRNADEEADGRHRILGRARSGGSTHRATGQAARMLSEFVAAVIFAIALGAAVWAGVVGIQEMWWAGMGVGGFQVDVPVVLPDPAITLGGTDGWNTVEMTRAAIHAQEWTPGTRALLASAVALRYLTFIVGAGVVISTCIQLMRRRAVTNAVRNGLFILGGLSVVTGVAAENFDRIAARMVVELLAPERLDVPRNSPGIGVDAIGWDAIDWTFVGSGVLQLLLACCFVIGARLQREVEGLV